MATASRDTTDPLAVSGWQPDDAESKSERYVGRRLAEASAEVKGNALTTFLLAAGVAGVSWLLLGVLAEHWLVPGGLPRGVRWGWMAVAVAAASAAAIRWVLPLIRYRVNLVYAARAIEREHPELHNDVVNAVLAQARPEETTPFVVRSLRRRAARQLSRVPNDGVVDYRPALWLASVLALLVIAAVIYELVAPKSLLVSTVRLVAPWAGIAAPSRTRIDAPTLQWRQPGRPVAAGDSQHVPVVQGTATLVRGRQLVVSTAIRNLRRGERPLALVTPHRDAGTTGTYRVPLAAGEDGGYEACLPDAARGLDESIDVVIAAGDAQTEPIRVSVIDAPTIVLREVTYDYPNYTGQEDRTVEWQGDLSAVEGTEVTLVAETNQPVDQAWVDFGCDGKGDVPLKPGQRDLARVRGAFELRLDAARSGPQHPTYRLMFKPKAAGVGGQRETVLDQLEHRIEVVPDLAPEVSIVFPEQKVVRVRPDAVVTVRVRAVDPDFGLASVVVETRLKDGPGLPGRDLLPARGTRERRTRFEGDETLVPERLGAGAGSVVEYRAVATDTRPKAANVTATEWQSLVIDAAAPPQPAPPPQRPRADDGSGDASGDDRAGEDGGPGGADSRPGADATAAEQRGDAGATDGRGDEPEPTDGPEPPQERERAGGEQRPSGDTGERERQQPKSRQKDPQSAQDEGAPQQGDDQGAADGGTPQGGTTGKTGDQAGQRQQDGSSDGAGGQPQGQGGAGQSGDQEGQQGADGTKPQRPGAGGREKKPDRTRGGGPQDAAADGGAGQRREGRDAGKEGGQAERRERVASDGTADGDAMERILEHRQTTRPEGEPGTDSRQRSEPAGQPQAKADKPAAQPGSGKKPDGTKDQPAAPDAGQAANRPPCSSPDGTPCGKPDCPSCKGGGAGGSTGGGAADGAAGAVAKDGKPGEAGSGGQTGGAGTGGEPGSAAGSSRGDGERGDVAARGDQGQAAGAKPGGSTADEPGGGRPGSGDTASSSAGPGPSGREGGSDAAGAEQPGTAGADRPAAGGDRSGGAASRAADQDGQKVADAEESGAANPAEESTPQGGGGVVGGGERQQANGGVGERRDGPTEWTEQDLAHARNAADLALEHLRRSVDSGERTVLDELGWTVEQAREFLARWERMRQAAGDADRRGRNEFDEAVKSLGLRADGVRRTADVPDDARGGQAEGRRSRPPSDYREQFKAFLQGASVE